MYTLALAVLVGLTVATLLSVAYELLPVLQKVKYINNAELLFPVLCVGAVWIADISILGVYGLGGQQWMDVVGSGLAIAGLAKATDAAVEYLQH